MAMAERVSAYHQRRTGVRPNLTDPKTYNDKVQWLKVYDQDPLQIVCCDKIAVRGHVESILGPDVLVPLAEQHDYPHVMKCNHNSGGAMRIENEAHALRVKPAFDKQLATPYGAHKGEWAYQFVTPQIMREKIIRSPTDYKAHCVDGQIAWWQIITARASGRPVSTILDPAGNVLKLQLDHDMFFGTNGSVFPGARAWSRLTEAAETLAQGWKYVRVDLYWSDGQVYFGELTFWPKSGCYMTKDIRRFGDMMPFDTTTKKPAVVT